MTREQLTAILTATRTESLRTGRGAVLNWDLIDAGVEIEVNAEAGDDTAIVLTLTRDEATELVHRLAATLLAN